MQENVLTNLTVRKKLDIFQDADRKADEKFWQVLRKFFIDIIVEYERAFY